MTPEPGKTDRRSEIYAGLMSGTSLDGVDIAIVDFADFPPQLRYCHTTDYSPQLRERLTQLCQSQVTTLDQLYSLDAELGEVYAEVVNEALSSAGIIAADVVAIGCHGQTIRHSPDSETPYTAQIGDPNRIVVGTGIDTVADLRGKDIALGGQAAPLAPAFHRFLFHSEDEDRAVINIGGIGNITWLPANSDAPLIGFDTGPGNTLLDHWVRRHQDQPYDEAGNWARSGTIDTDLLARILESEPYFHQPPPKSTGTEYFSASWLEQFISEDSDPAVIQATLVELTATTIADAIRALPAMPASCYLSGGGARNLFLAERLAQSLPECSIGTTTQLGLDADFVEACAFAWMARERINLRAAGCPNVTRSRYAAILGAVYAADEPG